jgi:tetratricopeptide (TPR) repeat protein
MSVTCPAETVKSKSFVNDGWKAWQKNDHGLVKENFLNAIKEDPKNTHAYWGLAFLYSLEAKQQDAWNTFKTVLDIEPNAYPYIYSIMNLNCVYGKELSNPEIVEWYKKIMENPDYGGVLRAMANERLGKYYMSRHNFAEAEKCFSDINSIDDWMLIGPFDNISASGYDKAYPPETEFSPKKSYSGQNGIPAKWVKLIKPRNDRWIDFLRYYAQSNAVIYANTFVYSPTKQTVQLRIGTSGFLRAFVNDQLVIDVFDEYNNDLDTYIAEVELQEGWNRLLVKCGSAEISACNFLARITDARGNKIDGLKISSDKQKYGKANSAGSKMIPNFAEEYFRDKIKSKPDEPENYMLLAETYLRNDKAVDAEMVLNEAIRQFPDCMLFYHKIAEAYARSKKNDEMETAYEKIFSADKSIPDVLSYKIMQLLKNEDYDKAEEITKLLEQSAPESQELIAVKLETAGNRKQMDKVLEISRNACEKFPYEYQYAYLDAAIKYQKTKKTEDAVKVFQDYLKRNFSDDALYAISQFYLQGSDITNWEKYIDSLIAYEPVSPGFYYAKANTFYAMRDYDKAEREINKALEFCYNSPQYWTLLGEICRMKNEKDRAIEMLNNALIYNPANYEARDMIRELQGKKSLYQQFATEDINSLVKNSPSKEAYPNDDGLVLLNSMKRLVYEKGASESTQELLVKVFNKKGIDSYKEHWADCYSNQQLIIEKAVTIKKDGSEIKADVSDDHIVFKSLEENDCIYIKHRIKNVFAGILAKYYWDSFNFSSSYPVKKASYSVLLENDSDFRYSAQNMSLKPEVKKTGEGSIYSWVLEDQPAVVEEYGMPELVDVGKVLNISNLPDWGVLVEWYSDLTKNKTRSDYEIKDQVKKLFEGRTSLSEEDKVRIIYDFITENIRYSSVSFRQSGLIPQRARDVLASKIGDCKDMATLCKAMLKEEGINSHYVLLSTIDNGRFENVLPSLLFNHCILAVETQKGEKFLDLTASNYPVKSLPILDINAFYLLIKPGVTSPGRIPSDCFQQSLSYRHTTVSISQEGSVQVKCNSRKTGLAGASFRDSFRFVDTTEAKEEMSKTLSRIFPNLKLLEYNCKNLNDFEEPVDFSYTFEAPGLLNETGNFSILRMPWLDELNPDYGFSYEKRQYPYYRLWPIDSLTEEIDINLPKGYEPMDKEQSAKFSSSFADYSLSTSYKDGVIHAKRIINFKNSLITPEDYSACKDFYNKVIKEDSKQVLLKKNI